MRRRRNHEAAKRARAAGLTLGQIAKEAGCCRAWVYRAFDDRKIAERVAARLPPALARILFGGDA
jgi:hypothetical protein